jgi:hypothetical protein
MRSGLHLDDRGHAVPLDTSDDAREPVPRGLCDDRALALAPILLEPTEVGERDETLTACGSPHAQSAGCSPATKRVDRNPEELGGLADSDRVISRFL